MPNMKGKLKEIGYGSLGVGNRRFYGSLVFKIAQLPLRGHRPHQSAAPFTPVDIQGIGIDNGSLYPAEFSFMIARC